MESPWKPYLRENILDPYPMYKTLRENDPIHKARSGEWVVTRYEDSRNILKDGRFLVGNRASWLNELSSKYLDQWEKFSAIVDALNSFMVFKNPPDHPILRKLVMQAWNNHEVDRILESNVKMLMNEVKDGKIDIATGLASRLPTMTMMQVLGLPQSDHDFLAGLSHQMMKSLDFYLTLREIEKMTYATELFIDYFEKLAKEKLAKADDTLISRIVALNKEEQQVPHHELIANCFFLFIAGGETTAGLIGPGLFHLISQDKLSEATITEEMIPKVVDELLRYDSPTQIVGRIASTALKIGDHQFSEGDLITVCLGAANRDPEKFAQPEELILDRSPNPHLAFSAGAHRCIGDWLAKREFECVLKEILARYDHVSITEPPIWKENFNFRCLQSLQVTFE